MATRDASRPSRSVLLSTSCGVQANRFWSFRPWRNWHAEIRASACTWRTRGPAATSGRAAMGSGSVVHVGGPETGASGIEEHGQQVSVGDGQLEQEGVPPGDWDQW